METKNSLKQRWVDFFKVFGDPWVIILFISTLVLIYISTDSEDKKLVGILNFIISLTSGLLGGLITLRLSQITELTVLVARGHSAIRGLKLVLLSVGAVEKRIKVNIDNLDSTNSDFKLIKSTYEEVIEKCNIIEEEIVSSIENWTDIIPEINTIKTQIGIISEAKSKVKELEDEITKSKNELLSTKEAEVTQRETIKKELELKEIELTKIKQELKKTETKLNNTSFGGGFASYPLTGSFKSMNSFIPKNSEGILNLSDIIKKG